MGYMPDESILVRAYIHMFGLVMYTKGEMMGKTWKDDNLSVSDKGMI